MRKDAEKIFLFEKKIFVIFGRSLNAFSENWDSFIRILEFIFFEKLLKLKFQ